jgi:hypothetical protein
VAVTKWFIKRSEGGVESAVFILVEAGVCPERALAVSAQKQVGDENEN